jgi:hypothetical protein
VKDATRVLACLDALDEQIQGGRKVEARQGLVRLVKQLVHDMRTPLGTFGLELYSLRATLEGLRSALKGGDLSVSLSKLEVLSDICDNLEGAHETAGRILGPIEQRVEAWGEDHPE